MLLLEHLLNLHQAPQFGLVLLLQGSSRGGQLLDGVVEFALNLQQPVTLFGAGLKLAFNLAELLPERVQLGQGGGGDCKTINKIKLTLIPAMAGQ